MQNAAVVFDFDFVLFFLWQRTIHEITPTKLFASCDFVDRWPDDEVSQR
jgi:NADH:ubiquinone oxidoreductase subunit 3 (subunit A)